MGDKVVINDNPVWGDIQPGQIFWEEVKAPENATLLDDDNKARKLSSRQLKSIKKRLDTVKYALDVWDYQTYNARLGQCHNRIKTAKRDRDKQQFIKAVNSFKALKEKPPALPPTKQKAGLVIKSEQDAQRYRLWIHRIQKRLIEHQSAVKNEVLYNELANEMMLEVSYFAQQIIERWSALGFNEEIYIKGKRRIKKVAFEEAHYTEDEIQYKIKVSSSSLIGSAIHHLPARVTAWNLVKPETLSELTAACERPVGSPHTENEPASFENGAWVIVYREGLTDGLFDYVAYSQVIAKYNPEKRDKFPIPIGVKRGRVVEWLYLTDHPHLMVNGISGSGKTNIIRVAVITWIQYHSPDEIRLYITDLKRGGDFRRFRDVPHLAADIMTTINELELTAPALVALMYQRMDTFNGLAVRDIDEYNQHNPDNRMQHIVVVIDECSAINDLAIDKLQKNRIWTALTLLATQARASGIHLLLGTQQSFADAIPKSVRDNITFVLSGRQRTLAGSMATFGTGRANRLPNIRGRMWCDNGGDLFQIQTPFLTPNEETEAIKIAHEFGQHEIIALPELDIEQIEAMTNQPEFTIDDVIRLSIEYFDGGLNQRKIHLLDETPDYVSRDSIGALIKEISALETVEYEGETYLVKKFGKGWKLETETTKSEKPKTDEPTTQVFDEEPAEQEIGD